MLVKVMTMSNANSGKRSKMTRQERAKQFMPFAALKGYEDALRQVEEEVEKQEKRDKQSSEGSGD